MTALKDRLAQHRSHMLGCGVAGLILVTGIVLSLPGLAIVGALACGAMCIVMVRMMFRADRTH